MVNVDLSQVEQMLDGLISSAESRRLDHEEATICHQIESAYREIESIVDVISRLDTEWRSKVFSGSLIYDIAFEERLASNFQRLASLLKSHLEVASQLEKVGYQVEGVAEAQALWNELRGILTPDSDFFDDPALTKRQDEAIDAYHRGETAEFEEMGD